MGARLKRLHGLQGAGSTALIRFRFAIADIQSGRTSFGSEFHPRLVFSMFPSRFGLQNIRAQNISKSISCI